MRRIFNVARVLVLDPPAHRYTRRIRRRTRRRINVGGVLVVNIHPAAAPGA